MYWLYTDHTERARGPEGKQAFLTCYHDPSTRTSLYQERGSVSLQVAGRGTGFFGNTVSGVELDMMRWLV